jgi:NAD(P)-dependent dehydrogenase (short-subunit alcohol dehydrogenase family)
VRETQAQEASDTEDAMQLADTTAIVTGAGQGVGRGIALALAAAGAKVAVAGRTLRTCEETAAEIAQRGGQALAVRCDVTSRDDVDAAVEAVHQAWGPISLVVNNAQSMAYGSIRRATEADLEMQWQSGPMGSLRFMQACFDDLRATRGLVVNVASGAGITAPPAMGGYAMAKEALRALTRVAAVEWGPHGIRVNALCPLAHSAGMDNWGEVVPGSPDAGLINDIPLRRLGDPEQDIGGTVVFLASAAGSYLTGTTLMVDGGYSYLR